MEYKYRLKSRRKNISVERSQKKRQRPACTCSQRKWKTLKCPVAGKKSKHDEVQRLAGYYIKHSDRPEKSKEIMCFLLGFR